MPVDGLEKPCGTCGRTSGDHTLREWAACIGETTTNLPFAEQPDDAVARAAAESMRQRFNLDENLIVADHVHIRAATLQGTSGPVGIKMPVLMHDFSVGLAGRPPVTVAEVAFLADVAAMRAYGRLVRDSANGAANAAEHL